MSTLRRAVFLCLLVASGLAGQPVAATQCDSGTIRWWCYPDSPGSCNSGCYTFCQRNGNYACQPVLMYCPSPNWCECHCW